MLQTHKSLSPPKIHLPLTLSCIRYPPLSCPHKKSNYPQNSWTPRKMQNSAVAYCVGNRRALIALADNLACIGSSACMGLHTADCYDLRPSETLFVFPHQVQPKCLNSCVFKAPHGHPELFRINLIGDIGYFKNNVVLVQAGLYHQTPACAAACLDQVFRLAVADEVVAEGCMYCTVESVKKMII
jgi:hypothetical protein